MYLYKTLKITFTFSLCLFIFQNNLLKVKNNLLLLDNLIWLQILIILPLTNIPSLLALHVLLLLFPTKCRNSFCFPFPSGWPWYDLISSVSVRHYSPNHPTLLLSQDLRLFTKHKSITPGSGPLQVGMVKLKQCICNEEAMVALLS